jgi:hypothetical protein
MWNSFYLLKTVCARLEHMKKTSNFFRNFKDETGAGSFMKTWELWTWTFSKSFSLLPLDHWSSFSLWLYVFCTFTNVLHPQWLTERVSDRASPLRCSIWCTPYLGRYCCCLTCEGLKIKSRAPLAFSHANLSCSWTGSLCITHRGGE